MIQKWVSLPQGEELWAFYRNATFVVIVVVTALLCVCLIADAKFFLLGEFVWIGEVLAFLCLISFGNLLLCWVLSGVRLLLAIVKSDV